MISKVLSNVYIYLHYRLISYTHSNFKPWISINSLYFFSFFLCFIETPCGAVKMFSNRSFVLYWKRYIYPQSNICAPGWISYFFLTVRFFCTCREELREKRGINWVSTESTRLLDTCEYVSVIHLFAITLHKVFIFALLYWFHFFFFTSHTREIILNTIGILVKRFVYRSLYKLHAMFII